MICYGFASKREKSRARRPLAVLLSRHDITLISLRHLFDCCAVWGAFPQTRRLDVCFDLRYASRMRTTRMVRMSDIDM